MTMFNKFSKACGCIVLVTGLAISQASISAVPTVSKVSVQEQARDASLEKLVKLMGLEEGLKLSLQETRDVVEKSMQQMLANNSDFQKLPENKKKQIFQVTKEMFANSLKILDTPEFSQIVVKAFIDSAKQYYTQKEVDAMIAFYATKEGQSIVKKQNPIMMQYMEKTLPVTMQLLNKEMQKQEADLKKKIQAIQQEQ